MTPKKIYNKLPKYINLWSQSLLSLAPNLDEFQSERASGQGWLGEEITITWLGHSKKLEITMWLQRRNPMLLVTAGHLTDIVTPIVKYGDK